MQANEDILPNRVYIVKHHELRMHAMLLMLLRVGYQIQNVDLSDMVFAEESTTALLHGVLT